MFFEDRVNNGFKIDLELHRQASSGHFMRYGYTFLFFYLTDDARNKVRYGLCIQTAYLRHNFEYSAQEGSKIVFKLLILMNFKYNLS